MGKRKIKTKEFGTRQRAIEAVKELLVGLESGEIAVGDGKDQLRLGVADDVKVTVKGKVKGAKVKVSLGLTWKIEGEVPVEVAESGPPAEKADAELPAEKEEAMTPAKQSKAKTPAKKEKAKTPAKKEDGEEPAKKPAQKKKEAAKKTEKKPAKKTASKKTKKPAKAKGEDADA